jgi:prophage antirepressor-like protein
MTNIFKTDNFLFDVENHDIRINGKQIKMVGTFEDPYFCGKDVAEALGYKNIKVTLHTQIDDEYKQNLIQLEEVKLESCGTASLYQLFYWPFTKPIDYHSGKAIYLSEQGVYSV